MTDRTRDTEKALQEGIRGGSMNVDPGHEGLPEAFDKSTGLRSTTGARTSASGTTGGVLDTATGPGLPRDHHGGMNPLKAFTSQGAVGKQFNPEGPIGSIPQSVGGPLDKEGVIGKQFTSDGLIGGTVDKLLGEKNQNDPLGRQ